MNESSVGKTIAGYTSICQLITNVLTILRLPPCEVTLREKELHDTLKELHTQMEAHPLMETTGLVCLIAECDDLMLRRYNTKPLSDSSLATLLEHLGVLQGNYELQAGWLKNPGSTRTG
jgi:hypothetical protein